MIKEIKVSNFKGIEELNLPLRSKIYALCGENGTGKTSLLEAINFGLTGTTKRTNLRNNTGIASVTLKVDDHEIERQLSADGISTLIDGANPKRVADAQLLFNGRNKADMSALNLLSSQKVEDMTSLEMLEFLVKFLPEKLTIQNVVDNMEVDNETKEFFIDSIIDQEMEVDSEISLEGIKSLHNYFYKQRTLYNKKVKTSITKVEKPDKTMEEIMAVLTDIAKKEAAVKMKKQFELNQAKYLAQIEELKKDLSVELKDMSEDKEKVVKMKQVVDECITQNRLLLSNYEKSVENNEKTCEALKDNKCPFSDKVICSTDKQEIIQELQKQIVSDKESILVGKEQLNNLIAKQNKIQLNINKIDENQTKYYLQQQKKEQLEKLLKNAPEVPNDIKNIKVEIDYSTEKELLKKQQMQISAYEDYLKKSKQLENDKKIQNHLNVLVSQLKENGPIIKMVMNYYVTTFNEAAQTTAQRIDNGFNVKFMVSENGLMMAFSFSEKMKFIPYDMLSGGEKVIATFIILDLINQLTNSKILVLDELDVLDNKRFKSFIDFLRTEYVLNNYDLILLTMTDTRRELIKEIDQFGKIDVISLK